MISRLKEKHLFDYKIVLSKINYTIAPPEIKEIILRELDKISKFIEIGKKFDQTGEYLEPSMNSFISFFELNFLNHFFSCFFTFTSNGLEKEKKRNGFVAFAGFVVRWSVDHVC